MSELKNKTSPKSLDPNNTATNQSKKQEVSSVSPSLSSRSTSKETAPKGSTTRETYQERVERKMAEYEKEKLSKIQKKHTDEGTNASDTKKKDEGNITTTTPSQETYQDRVERKMAQYEQEKQSKTTKNQTKDGAKDSTKEIKKNGSSTGENQNSPQETYQERVERKMAYLEQVKQNKTQDSSTKEASNTSSANNNTTDGNTLNANQNASTETYQERVERKMAQYEKEKQKQSVANSKNCNEKVHPVSTESNRQSTNQNNDTSLDAVNENTSPRSRSQNLAAARVGQLPRPLASNDSSQHSNEILDLVSAREEQELNPSANDSNSRDPDSKCRPSSVATSQSSTASRSSNPDASGTPNSRVRNAILTDKGAERSAEYLRTSDDHEGPGVYQEYGRGPGSLPAWARPNNQINGNTQPSNMRGAMPGRPYQSLHPVTASVAVASLPVRTHRSLEPATTTSADAMYLSNDKNNHATAPEVPACSPHSISTSIEASNPSGHIDSTEASDIAMESQSDQKDELRISHNSGSFSVGSVTSPKSSTTAWYSRTSFRIIFGVFILVVIAIGVSVPLLLDSDTNMSQKGNEEAQQSNEDVLAMLSDVSNATLIKQDGTPQQLAFDWIVNQDKLSTTEQPEKLKSRYALAVFYFATGGESSWIGRDNWLDGEVDECEWEFLTCSIDKITKMEMYYSSGGKNRGNGLEGTLPMKDLTMLTALVTLGISKNRISGTIDPVISSFSNLRVLYLNKNELSGTIPEELFQLTTLEILALEDNDFEGSVSTSIGKLSMLEKLALHINRFTGTIPETLYDLTSLTSLELNDNDLGGSISPMIGNLQNMEIMFLASNRFTDSIPESVYNLTSLKTLSLEDNNLGGSISHMVVNLQNLEGLWLGKNDLSSSIPTEIGLMTNLQKLSLESNHLSGSILPIVGNLPNLEGIDIHENDLSSSIPTEIGLMTNLEILIVSDNKLSSSLPTEMGLLTQIEEFGFHSTNITGTIPRGVCDLNMEKLCCNKKIVDENSCCSKTCSEL